MKKSLFFASFIFVLSSALAAQSEAPASFWNAQNLQADKECLLKIVRQKMNSDKQNPSPLLRVESETPFKEYQDAMEVWWKFRPEVFVNVFDAPKNTIYLTNNKNWYKAPRTPVDSLVHELTHYVQSIDLDKGGGDPDQLEIEAIQVQDWFRTNYGQYIQDEKYQGPCP